MKGSGMETITKKRGRGRPKGSRNKNKLAISTVTSSTINNGDEIVSRKIESTANKIKGQFRLSDGSSIHFEANKNGRITQRTNNPKKLSVLAGYVQNEVRNWANRQKINIFS